MFTETILEKARQPVALIGNATSRHPFGRLIDGYGTVIRLNNFRIAGYEHLVGTRTDYRCVTGWVDVENRNEHVEFTPFTANAKESANLELYNRNNEGEVISARNDVHPLITEVPNPSTGFALIQLLNLLRIPADLFGFDGFKSDHYWSNGDTIRTTHSRNELEYILKRDNVLLFNQVHDYQRVYDFCHREYENYGSDVGLQVVKRLGLNVGGLRVLEFGAGNGDLAAYLESRNNQVTAVEVSKAAFDRIQCTDKIHGGTLTLPFLGNDYDLFISIDVLEHLAVNDVKMLIRQAARLCNELIVTVSSQPSNLLGPDRENLHLTVRPPEWWHAMFSGYFEVKMFEGFFDRQYIIVGSRRRDAGIMPQAVPPSADPLAYHEETKPERVA